MIHDVVVCGAGPGGATTAWYLARAGVKVALVEKKQFPRDKLCGEAVAVRAQAHLRRMGVLQEIEAAGLGNWARVGGFITTTGLTYVGDSTSSSQKIEFDADGVLIYTKRLMPGYAALFREANGEVNYCCYIIPGGACTLDDMHSMHHELLESHPYVRDKLAGAEIDKMRAAPLRLAGSQRVSASAS